MDADDDLKQIFESIMNMLKPYFGALRQIIGSDHEAFEAFQFLLEPSLIIIYLGKHHVAVEYSQSTEKLDDGIVATSFYVYSDAENILDHIVDIKFDATHDFQLPVGDVIANTFVPSNDALDYLIANGWNVTAQMLHQDTALLLNSNGLQVINERFLSIRNSFFYGLDNSGNLKVRHIKWLDVFPCRLNDAGDYWHYVIEAPPFEKFIMSTLEYEPPELQRSQLAKLVHLNRFVELINTPGIHETQITKFVSEPDHQFILKLYFSAISIRSELQLKWVSQPDRAAIRPDFFVTLMNGFADIVDFKLPRLNYEPIRGDENRRRFSAKIAEYAGQLRTYRTYFDDYSNRMMAKATYEVNVNKPKIWLVIGRRNDFAEDDWREVQDSYNNLCIITYDDLIDATRSAVYLIVNELNI